MNKEKEDQKISKEEIISNTDEKTVEEKETIMSEENDLEKQTKTEEEIAKEKKLAKKQKRRNRIGNIMFVLALIFLLTTVYKYVNLEEGEKITIFGYQPVVILTDSMDPEIKKYGIALLKYTDDPAATVEVGDTIAFTVTDDEGEKDIVHEVIAITDEGYQTQGVANSAPDPYIVTEEMVYAEVVASTNITNYIYYHFAGFLCLMGVLILLIAFIKMRKSSKKAHEAQAEELAEGEESEEV